MDQNSIILYSIIVAVLIGVPLLISRKTGIKPTEMLLGKIKDILHNHSSLPSLFSSSRAIVLGNKNFRHAQLGSCMNECLYTI